MSSAAPQYEVGAVVLGFVGLVATWRRKSAAHKYAYEPLLIIHSAATTDENAHTPAQTVEINSRVGLLALRQAIDEALTLPEAAQ